MIIKRKLALSREHFFQKLLDSVRYDIREQTGKTLASTQLSGFHYEKRFANYQSASITITECSPPERYAFTLESNKQSFTTEYLVEALSEHSCQLTYQEKMVSKGLFQQLNDFVLQFFLGYFKKKQFQKMLDQMES